jgi:hypothetical protein
MARWWRSRSGAWLAHDAGRVGDGGHAGRERIVDLDGEEGDIPERGHSCALDLQVLAWEIVAYRYLRMRCQGRCSRYQRLARRPNTSPTRRLRGHKLC